MSNPKIEIDAFLKDADFIKSANKIQVEIDRINTISQKTGISTSALNQAMRDQEKVAKSNSMSWTEFRSMYSTVLDVLRIGQAVWDETGQKYVDNAIKVGDMARSLGVTTEEASRLKEVADDVGISIQSLTTAFRAAQKDGFQPNIEGLARMADEYNALAPGVERTQYLLDRFGKSGEEMGKLLDKGSDSILKNAAAISESMLVTQEGYEAARQYQISVDALSDSWDAFTYQVAPPLVKAMTSIIDSQRDHFRAYEILEEQGLRAIPMYDKRYQAARKQAEAERETADANLQSAYSADQAGGAFESEAEKTARLADEAKMAAEALDIMTKSNQGMLSLIGNLQGEMDSYNEKWVAAVEQYGEGSDAVKKLEADHAKAMARISVDLFIAKLSVDGLTDAEYEAALQAQLSAGLIDQATVDMAMAWDASADAAAANTAEIEKSRKAAEAAAKKYYMEVVTNYVNQGVPPSVAATITNPPKAQEARGTGGAWKTVPQGYPNDSYMVAMQSGEQYSVKTPGEVASGGNGGGSTTIILNNYGTVMMPERGNENAIVEQFG